MDAGTIVMIAAGIILILLGILLIALMIMNKAFAKNLSAVGKVRPVIIAAFIILARAAAVAINFTE